MRPAGPSPAAAAEASDAPASAAAPAPSAVGIRAFSNSLCPVAVSSSRALKPLLLVLQGRGDDFQSIVHSRPNRRTPMAHPAAHLNLRGPLRCDSSVRARLAARHAPSTVRLNMIRAPGEVAQHYSLRDLLVDLIYCVRTEFRQVSRRDSEVKLLVQILKILIKSASFESFYSQSTLLETQLTPSCPQWQP
jgi:hypothetical protein